MNWRHNLMCMASVIIYVKTEYTRPVIIERRTVLIFMMVLTVLFNAVMLSLLKR